jgi:hypothetical protein
MTDACQCQNCTNDDLLIPQMESPPIVPSQPTPRRTIIAFSGLAGSGKSTAAAHLVERHGFERIRFAGPLKDMMRALGLSEREIEGDLKEKPCALLCGHTPRHGMQTLGTEWGRTQLGVNLWINAWRAAVDRLAPTVPVVVDDCRFPNEAEAILAAGGDIVRIVRTGAGVGAAGHSSEGHQLPFVFSIENNGTTDDLFRAVDQLVASLSWANAVA